MQQTPQHASDIEALLQTIRSWLTDPAAQPEQRLVICAVQRDDVIQLVDGTPLDQAIRRITIESGHRGAASRPGQEPSGRGSPRVPGRNGRTGAVQRGRMSCVPPGAPVAVSDHATKSAASSA